MMKFKKIEPGAFPELPTNVCRILLLREEMHTDGIIGSTSSGRLTLLGITLKDAGLSVAATSSSPSDSVIHSALITKIAMSCVGGTHTYSALGDLDSESIKQIEQLRLNTKADNIPPIEQFIYTLCETDAVLHNIMVGRGNQSAGVLQDLACDNLQKTVLVSSHGGSLIEALLLALRTKLTAKTVLAPEYFVPPGNIVEIIIGFDGVIQELNYLQHPSDDNIV